MTQTDARLGAPIVIDGAPDIPGLAFRHYAGEADLVGMLAVHRAANLADGTEDVVSLERMVSNYAHLPNSDPFEDVTIAEVDRQTVAYSRVLWSDLNDGGRGYELFGFVHPEWRRRGLGACMLPRNESLLRRIARTHGGVSPKWFQSYSQASNVGNMALLERAGYQAVRYGFDMVLPTLAGVPDVPMPRGLEVRAVERGQYRQIWEASNEAFRDEWGEHDESEESWANFESDPSYADASLWSIGWDGDEVAGLVLVTIPRVANEHFGRARVWLDAVAVRRPWRRRGLARALMARSLRAAGEAGFTSAGLGVDSENPSGALRLYESLGFAPARRSITYRKPLD